MMCKDMTRIAKNILQKTMGRGVVSAGEVLIIGSKDLHFEVENGNIDVVKNSYEMILALRVLIGQCLGFGFCTDFSDSSIDSLIKMVTASARNTDEDPHYLFPLPQSSSISLEKDAKLSKIGFNEKLEQCKEMERTAYSVDSRIKAARNISYSEKISDIYLINTNGVDISFSTSSCSTFAMVVAQDDADAQMSWEMDLQTFYNRLKWAEVAREAAKKALAMLGAKSIGTRKSPVILSPPAAVSVLGAFAPAFYADSVQKGRSLMSGSLGKKVGSGELNLIDNGLLPEGVATAPYDDEGVPMQKTMVVENGDLRAFLYDTYTAHKDKVTSTGNGKRPGIKMQPQVGATNMYFEKGSCTEKELFSLVKEGLYVNEIMGAHTINPISGDFSIGATGHWLEDGAKAFPVRGITLSGNMLDLFKNIVRTADNLRFYGHFGSPSLLVSEIIISGGNG